MSRPDFIRPELVEILPTYQLCRDCYKGETAVKGRIGYTAQNVNNGGGSGSSLMLSPYLPDPSPKSEKEEVRSARYNDYVTRAVFYNVTKRTVKAMSGAVFSKYPTFTLNELSVLETDVNGAGQSIVQQSREALTNCLLQGRGGLLADMPVNNEGMSKAEMARLKVRPTIIHYDSESIINWRYRKVDGVLKNSLVVLSESYVTEDDGYEQKTGRQLLVLRLNDADKAESEILRKSDNGEWISQGVNPITDHNGSQLTELPFYPYGSVNNDLELDDVPIFDIAHLNIAHFRDSADYQEANFISAQPTLVLTGLTEQWVNEVLKDGVAIGSRSGLLLPQGGDAQLIQAQSDSAIMEAMKHKEAMLQSLGAKLIENNKTGQAKTATEASAENAEETSVLSSIANNVSDAYSKAIRMCAAYMGYKADDLVYTLNTNFGFSKMTVEQRAQLIAEWQSGAVTFGEMRAQLVESEVATIEDETEAANTIASEQGALFDSERVTDGE